MKRFFIEALFWLWFLVILPITLISVCTGCSPNPPTAQKKLEKIEKDREVALSLLPAESIIKKELGNNWYIVEIKIDNQQSKQFLFHWWYGSHSERGSSLTEIK
jgi:lipopolysaccharide export LptBFGC system permease protein LptF